MRLKPLPLLVLACLTACEPGPERPAGTGALGSHERLEEVRSRAAELLPGARLYQILGMAAGGTFADGLCSSWIYSFHSPESNSLLRVYLGRDGLIQTPYEAEPLQAGETPPPWNADAFIDSSAAAAVISGHNAEGFIEDNEIFGERYLLYGPAGAAEPRWEITLLARDNTGFAKLVFTVDALDGELLDKTSAPFILQIAEP
jgi:hypothetical protein